MSSGASAAAAAAAPGSGTGASTDTLISSGVDEGLYSRQLYVFGHEAQKKLASARVLLVGLRGLGVETAKNVILAGVHSVGLLDPRPVAIADLGAQFYLTEASVGKPRDETSLTQLQTLNPYVHVHVVKEAMSTDLLARGEYDILCLTDSTLADAIKYNAYCHANHIQFLWAEVPGVYASIFVDLPGPRPGTSSFDAQLSAPGHYVSDLTGEQPARGLLAHVSNANPGVVTVHEDARHGLQDGDYVTFEEVEGMVELNADRSEARPVKVLTPFSFTIEDTTLYTPYTGTKGYFQQVKRGKFFQFQSLADTLLKDTPISNDNWGNEKQIHLLHVALGRYREAHGRLPRVDTMEDAQAVVELVKKLANEETSPKVEGLNEYLLGAMARVASAELNPLCAFMGGVLGQEVLKAASGKFVPIQQYYYYDASHVLPSKEEAEKNSIDLKEYAPRGTRYDSQIAVFGAALQQKLQQQSYFVVGAGAIGSEMVKNFAMMGLGTATAPDTGKPGTISITDMDTIERSNLNRQFLFRSENVGAMKSITAAAAVKKMNPSMNIVAQSVRVAPETQDLYDDRFWEALDGVVTALDNVEARIYVDQRCIYYQRPMIDSGTLGTKGSTQVVVPFLTESYGSSRDAPEESIPVCTLKNFPHKIEHTIQWARDLFEGLFKSGPSEVNNYLTQPHYLDELAEQQNVQLTNLETVKKYLLDEKPASFEDCVRWARMVFEQEYHYNIAQLLYNFPRDHETPEGQPFWSGAKRPPTPLQFDPTDPTMLEFVLAAANLRAVNYNIAQSRDLDTIRRICATVHPDPFVAQQNKKIAVSEAEAKAMLDAVADDHDAQVAALTSALPKPETVKGYHLQAIEFEKDAPENFHIDFVTACSNLRARNYAIKECTKHETKFIAGRIIPALATTTALVTGMVCLEIYKLVQPAKRRIEDFRCFSCNLALPILSTSEPIAPATTTTVINGKEWKWSLWDRIDVNEGDITLEAFLAFFKAKYGLQVTMVSFGPAFIYCPFGVGWQRKVAERLPQKMSELVNRVLKAKGNGLQPKERYLILEVTVQDEDEEEVQIPYVRFQFQP